jgi:hypothetical protein
VTGCLASCPPGLKPHGNPIPPSWQKKWSHQDDDWDYPEDDSAGTGGRSAWLWTWDSGHGSSTGRSQVGQSQASNWTGTCSCLVSSHRNLRRCLQPFLASGCLFLEVWHQAVFSAGVFLIHPLSSHLHGWMEAVISEQPTPLWPLTGPTPSPPDRLQNDHICWQVFRKTALVPVCTFLAGDEWSAWSSFITRGWAKICLVYFLPSPLESLHPDINSVMTEEAGRFSVPQIN